MEPSDEGKSAAAARRMERERELRARTLRQVLRAAGYAITPTASGALLLEDDSTCAVALVRLLV